MDVPAAPPLAPPPPRKPAAARCRPAPLAADLRVAVMRTSRRLRQEGSTGGVTDGQYAVLATLDSTGPTTLRALAASERVQPPSMTRTVTALAEAGLVTRGGDPEDGRHVVVTLTEAGARHVKETRRRRDAWLAARLGELGEDDRAVLARAAELLAALASR